MGGLTTGMGEKDVGNSVSKHGAVILTRTLASDFVHHGVMIKAICQYCCLDTSIVASAKELANQPCRLPELLETRLEKEFELLEQLEKRIQNSGWMMTPKHVATGFYKLVTECHNGDVMAVIKDTPYFIVPDDSEVKITILALMAMLIGRITGSKIIYVSHQKIFTFLFLVFMIILINCIY